MGVLEAVLMLWVPGSHSLGKSGGGKAWKSIFLKELEEILRAGPVGTTLQG